MGSCQELEEELYSGRIRSDQDLVAKAKELGASLQVSDGREKVWRRGDVLVGEVTEISPRLERRRRIYLVPGAHLIAEIEGGKVRITDRGRTGCVIFGNRFTQMLAGEGVRKAQGKVNEDLIKRILEEASGRTASVSRESTVLCAEVQLANPDEAILRALEEDCLKSGWRLCGR